MSNAYEVIRVTRALLDTVAAAGLEEHFPEISDGFFLSNVKSGSHDMREHDTFRSHLSYKRGVIDTLVQRVPDYVDRWQMYHDLFRDT